MTPSSTAGPSRPVPGAPGPPGSRLRRSWRRAILTSVVCLILGFGVFLLLLGFELESEGNMSSAAFVLLVLADAAIGVGASVLVGPIRRSRTGNVIIVVAAIVSTWALPAFVVSVVRLGARRSIALDLVVVALTALGGLGATVVRDLAVGRPSEDLVLITVIGAAGALILLLWGRARGTRAALMDALREQAASAEESHRASERTREAVVARARAEERSAIARDMHDGISHQLAIVAMHAGALAYRTDLAPEQQRDAAQTVRDAAAEGSVMLRDALVALRTSDGTESRVPLRDSVSIEHLVELARDAGHEVELHWSGISPTELDAMPGRAPTVARIVEELLVNARKYAPGAAHVLRIERDGEVLVLRSSNPLVGPPVVGPPSASATGTGLGLVGVAERAVILGGSARFGPTAGNTFEVEVRLP